MRFISQLRPFATAFVACLALGGCGSPDETSSTATPVTDTAGTQIFGAAQAVGAGQTAADGVVALRIGTGSQFELCSGALLAPNVVLTARHCVSTMIVESVACNDAGESLNGDHVGPDHDINEIHVFGGQAADFNATPLATAKAIVHGDGFSLCDSDIALIVTDANIPGTILPIRLEGTESPGETIRAIGYGANDESLPVGTRLENPSVSILAVGKGTSASKTALGAHEFEVGVSMCSGDSGGPAVSVQTNAIVGVVSRGGDCSDDFGHIYTRTSGFGELVTRAFDVGGGAPIIEPPPPAITEPAPSSSSSCSASPRAHGEGTSASFAIVLAACAVMVRRRKSKTK